MFSCFSCKKKNMEQSNENDMILDYKLMEESKLDSLVNGYVYQNMRCIIPKDIIKIIIHFHGIYNINFESNILIENSIKKDFIAMLCKQLNVDIKLERIYSGINDGFYSQIFHTQCDNKGEMIYLIKNEHNYIFGGYTSISGYDYGNSKDPNAFLYVIYPNVKIFPLKDKSKNAFWVYDFYFINFGITQRMFSYTYPFTNKSNSDSSINL